MRPDTVAAALERHRAHAALVFALDEELGTHHGIAWNDFALLAALDGAGGALSEKDLAGITSLRRSRLHLQLAPLEKLGLVHRAAPPGSTTRLCALRPGGKRVLEEARRTVADLCEGAGAAG